MTSRYRHRRTPNPGTAFPSPIEPGEIAVNTANRQLAVGDADNGSPGVPLTLIGVRYFDARASYAIGDFVVQGGSLYRAKSAVNPGAFNAASWDLLSTDVSIKAYADAGDAAVSAAFAAADASIVTNYQAADTALTTSVNGKVAKAGDTMTGPLVLPVAAPTSDPQAANKKYVDDKIASIPTPSSLTVSDTPPVGVPDGALWWESDSGLLYVRYNDGNTVQWVIAAPQPDINAFALKTDVVAASAAEYIANSAPTKMLTPGAAWSAAAPVTLADAASVAPDCSLGLDFYWPIGAAGRTLANPTNAKMGQKGYIRFYNSGGTVTSWGSAYKFSGGVKPAGSVVGQVDVLSYIVIDATYIVCVYSAGFA